MHIRRHFNRLLFSLFWLNFQIYYCLAEISCLVMRPGFGLVSEQCPSSSVGCRIRANKDHVEWYEWAKLYDRNQLVCVYPGEYESSTGCVKKPSGNVRCWCGGRKDCNNPETSRDIYEAFLAGDTEKLENIARWLKKPIVEEKVDPIEKALVDKLPGGTKPTRHPKGRIHSTRKTSTTDAATSTAPSVTSKMTTTRRPRQRIAVKSSKQPPITATEASWSSTQPSTSSGKAVHRHKTTMSTKSSATTEDPLIKTQKNLELDNDKVMNMPTDDALQLDSTFEETRKKLQKDMREEEKRMAEYFADEDKEVTLDEEDKTEDELFETAEDQRRKEREQYMKRRNRDDYERNLAEEEERLARMEREEERNHIKEDDEYDNISDDEYDKRESEEAFRKPRDQSSNGLFTNTSFSSSCHSIIHLFSSVLLSIFALHYLRL